MAGLTWAPVEMALGIMNIATTGARSFYQNQRIHVQTINQFFQTQMKEWQKEISSSVTVQVDARYDTPGKYNVIQKGNCTVVTSHNYFKLLGAIFPGFCANKATVVFLDHDTSKIIHLEIGDSREVERKSNRLEGFLIERGLRKLQSLGIKVQEVVSDASRTIISLLGKFHTKYLKHCLCLPQIYKWKYSRFT